MIHRHKKIVIYKEKDVKRVPENMRHTEFFTLFMYPSRHFSSYQQSKFCVTQRNGRYSAVKSSKLSWAGQYKKCVQYNYQFTSEYSGEVPKWTILGPWAINSILNYHIKFFYQSSNPVNFKLWTQDALL